MVWDRQVGRQFTILSDPGAVVIRQYGLLQAGDKGDPDIAIRTTMLVDENGHERWRRVSESVMDIPRAVDTLARIRATP